MCVYSVKLKKILLIFERISIMVSKIWFKIILHVDETLVYIKYLDLLSKQELALVEAQ